MKSSKKSNSDYSRDGWQWYYEETPVTKRWREGTERFGRLTRIPGPQPFAPAPSIH
jgi:hypothetical protein